MNKDDFLVAVKLATGIEIKLGREYYWGYKNGVIKPVEFMIDGFMYEYKNFYPKIIIKNGKRVSDSIRTAFASYEQLMEFVNDIIEMIPEKIHHKWMMRP